MDNPINLITQTLPPDQVRANAIAALQSEKDFILISIEQVDGKFEFNVDTNLTTNDAKAVLTFVTGRSQYVHPGSHN